MSELIVAVVTSGVLGTIIGHVLTAARDEVTFKRTKLEALYMHAAVFCTNLGLMLIPWAFAARDKISLNDALDQQNSVVQGEGNERNLENARMLAGIYFPGVQPALGRIFEARDSIGEAIHRLKAQGKPAEGAASHHAAIARASKQLSQAEEQLRAAILLEAKRLNRAWWKRLPWLRSE